MTHKFVHLHTHSVFSLAKSTITVDEITEIAMAQNLPAIGIADTNSLAGAYAVSKSLMNKGIQPIIGSEMPFRHEETGIEGQIVGIAKTRKGYINLMRMVTYCRTGDTGTQPISIDMLEQHSEDVIILSGGWNGVINNLLKAKKFHEAMDLGEVFSALFPSHFYMEIQRHDHDDEETINNLLIRLAGKIEVPLVASVDAYYATKDMAEPHDALMCIGTKDYVVNNDRLQLPSEHYLKSEDEMVSLFSDIPDALENSVQIAKRCAYGVTKVAPDLPEYPDLNGQTAEQMLTKIAADGLKSRLDVNGLHEGCTQNDYRARLDYELKVINDMGFPGYFLIVYDFINWAKQNNIPVGPGRGSGAGSVVAWALGITELDPLKHGLLFERFLNPDRVSMPDFDIDFCQTRRGEVIQYVKDRYGHDRVAGIGTIGKLQAKAALRDVGRVLSLPYGLVDRFARMIPDNPSHPVKLVDAIEFPELKEEIEKADADVRRMFTIAVKLEGMFRNCSTHAAGIVISNGPMADVAPLYRDDNGNIVTQFDMKSVEDVGLVKFDFLGLKTLTLIQEAVDLVKSEESEFDLFKIDERDAETFEMLSDGNAYGVFQLESSGMQIAMKQVQPEEFEDIVALGALYRPGPMENIPVYADRKHGFQEINYPHPLLEQVLKETNGVIIYQEQVMEIAKILAGYSLAQADLLRRAMGKKIKSEMDIQRVEFVSGAQKNGISEDKAIEIFDLVARFADYGFNKSHAAAYGLLSYQTAYLRCHHPYEFMTANLNIEKDAKNIAAFFEEARRMKLNLLKPDINLSGARFTIEKTGRNKAIRYALSGIRGCGVGAMEAIMTERQRGGKFTGIGEMIERCGKAITSKTAEHLAKAGALDALAPGKNRNEILTSLPAIRAKALNKKKHTEQMDDLFATLEVDTDKFERADAPNAIDILRMEVESMDICVSAEPQKGWDQMFRQYNPTKLAKLAVINIGNEKERRDVCAAAIVTDYKTKISKNDNPYGVINICDPSGSMELMVFGDTFTTFRDKIEKGGTYVFKLDIVARGEDTSIFLNDLTHIEIKAAA